MPTKYTGIALKRDAELFSSAELSRSRQACKPLLNLALSLLCEVHCLPQHMQEEAQGATQLNVVKAVALCADRDEKQAEADL
eukprot:2938176-Rhodomonas_salina.2